MSDLEKIAALEKENVENKQRLEKLERMSSDLQLKVQEHERLLQEYEMILRPLQTQRR